MSIATFRTVAVQRTVVSLSGCPELAVFVGAGCSIEAGLPSWETLVQRLLDRAARERGLFSDDSLRTEWVDAILRVESLIDAASIVEGLIGPSQLAEIVSQELFRDAPADFIASSPTSNDGVPPAQIALQIAHLYEAFLDAGGRLRLYTTNYDNLLETALRIRLGEDYTVAPYVEPDPKLDNALTVRHLHGYLGHERPKTPVVLTARSYFAAPENRWQVHEVLQTLENVPSLFLGTSLADLNLLKYLHERRGRERRHAAVFVRQAEQFALPESVRKVREEAAVERWNVEGIDVIFVDHYSDVAQLVAEIACSKTRGELFTPMPRRIERYFAPLRARVLRQDLSRERFLRRQMLLNRTLAGILERACARLAKRDIDLSGEIGLALALWLVDDDGDTLTCWASTDRIYTDATSMQITEVNPHHRFAASKAYCNGSYVEDRRSFRNSRWSFIAAMPLWTRYDGDLGRIPIGSLTIMTKTAATETTLADLSLRQRATLSHALTIPTLSRLDDLREPAP